MTLQPIAAGAEVRNAAADVQSAAAEPALSRRGFLKSTAALSGGLIMALYLPGCSKPEDASKAAGPAKISAPNAWLRIGSDNSITGWQKAR